MQKLVKAVAGYSLVQPYGPTVLMPGYRPQGGIDDPTYHETIELCRYFHKRDPIAGTVVNRMAAMSVTTLRNRWNKHSAQDKLFWAAVAESLRKFYKTLAVEYFVHGLIIPEYALTQVVGKDLNPKITRRSYMFPTELWNRDVMHIRLRKRPTSSKRSVFIEIPPEDVAFIKSGGIYSDGAEDKQAFRELKKAYPKYVSAVIAGQTLFTLEDATPIMRDPVSYDDYPAPFLRNALKALQHKEYLKQVDRTIAQRAINAIRQVRVGSDEFPADDDDIAAIKTSVDTAASNGDGVFNLYTNHTVAIEWIFPPLDVLINEAKYAEPNSDIFLAMGFPRVLTVGETARSNSSDAKIALLGPISTLTDVRDQLLIWTRIVYAAIAKANNLVAPDPYFSPIPIQDITSLIQFSNVARDAKAISRDVISQLYGTTFEDEAQKMQEEEGILKKLGLDTLTELQKTTEITNPPEVEDNNNDTRDQENVS